MYTQVGSCPKCGAPIYSPSSWMAITPPPSYPSCSCNADSRPRVYTTDSLETYDNQRRK